MTAAPDAPVQFVGHPFAPIGKGEEMRANLRALLSLDEPAEVLDVYRISPRDDPDYVALVEPIEARRLGPGLRVFHLNGDEVEPVLRHLAALGSDFAAGRNVLVPAWELPVYPAVWVEALRRFDEVWAISRFVQEGLAASGISSRYIGQSLELPIRPFLSRRYFGLREAAFVFLCFFDFSSYAARKNPGAALAMFRRLLAERPFDDIQLALKVKGDAAAAEALQAEIDLPRDSFVLINKALTSLEQHSLIAASDCLVSLHRSEGFGRGCGEAMRLGRLALATGWSGNMDFMNEGSALLVRSELVPVGPGEYVEAEGQVWAEPDQDHALHLARWAVDHPADARRMAQRGQDDVLRTMGNRAVGLRALEGKISLEP